MSRIEVVEDMREEGTRRAANTGGALEEVEGSIEAMFRGQLTTDLLRQQKLKFSQVEHALHTLRNKRAQIASEQDRNTVRLVQADADYDHTFKSHVNNADSKVKPSDVVGFWFSSVLLVAVAVFLFVFYYQVGFQAIFADYRSMRDATTALFNAHAFELFRVHPGNALFLLLLPTVVITFGWVAHQALESRQYIGMVVMGLITLSLDVILAMNCIHQMYNTRFLSGAEKLEWTTAMAFRNSEFYLLIILGFVTYVIWGVVLHHALDKWNKLRLDKDTLKDKLATLEFRKGQLLKERARLEHEASAVLEQEKEMLGQRELFQQLVETFMSGWYAYLYTKHHDRAAICVEEQKAAEERKDATLHRLFTMYSDGLTQSAVERDRVAPAAVREEAVR